LCWTNEKSHMFDRSQKGRKKKHTHSEWLLSAHNGWAYKRNEKTEEIL